MSELWIAAGVTAAAAVGTAAYGAATSNKGAGAGGALPTYKPVTPPAYNPQAGAQSVAQSYPTLQNIAGQATNFMTNQREKILPGSQQLLRGAGQTLNSYIQGNIPQDVINQTNRTVAQRTGGGFNPFTQGGQAPADFARSIGQTSLGIQQAGLSQAAGWLQLANSFVVNPITQVGPLAAQAQQNQYAYDALGANVGLQNAQSQYYSQANQQQLGMIQGQQQGAAIQTALGGASKALQSGAAIYGAYQGQNPQIPYSNVNFGGSQPNPIYSPIGGHSQGGLFLGNYSTGAT